jgi:antitoxin component YwqK of YwqJK toxin-antitoxin module
MRYALLFILLCGCAVRSSQDGLTSIQIVDRNGFSETISSKDRLASYKTVDFERPQPYQKVLRVFSRDKEGKTSSKITSYHNSGQIWESLDIYDGRDHGAYKDASKTTWMFDGVCRVWDEQNHLIAEITYEKGLLESSSLYYFSNGQIQQSIPYLHNEIHGTELFFDSEGALIEKRNYEHGVKSGLSERFVAPLIKEQYDAGHLTEGWYNDMKGEVICRIEQGRGMRPHFEGEKLASLTEYQGGVEAGLVQLFAPDGSLSSSYIVREGKKQGEEKKYYPHSTQTKLSLFWQDDAIHGMVKTWYADGSVESQKEMSSNKKQGLSFAWYPDGSLMLMEEYDADLLTKGSYFKKGDKRAISEVESGRGTATLFDSSGHLLQKISYEAGRPSLN